MLENVSPAAEPVAPHTPRPSAAGQLGRAALALALALGGSFALARDAHAASPFAGSWSGPCVLTSEYVPGPIEGSVAVIIGPGGHIEGAQVLEAFTFSLEGVVTQDGKVLLNALPASPGELGATFMGTATIDSNGRLLMSLSSVNGVFQLEIVLRPQ